MARANRHHVPNQIWHITHRCHKQEFLLKFAQTRKRYIHWLYQARKSIAVRSAEFAQRIQVALGARGRKRKITENDDGYVLRETEESYGSVFGVENGSIASNNALLWDICRVKTEV